MLILWDFNGTLLDDLDLTLEINEGLFQKAGLPRMTRDEYRKRFRFPVREFYRDIGVCTDEDYAEIADAWYKEYIRRCAECSLHDGVREALETFRRMNCQQVILSASQQDVLRRQVSYYPGIEEYFDQILGLNHIFGDSKVALALQYCRLHQIDPKDCIFLGDSVHDAETADAIGCRCILISAGHQDESVLRTSGKPVVRSVSEAVELICR